MLQNNDNEFILTIRYLNRGFHLVVNKNQFEKINNNEIMIFIQPNHLKELEEAIKYLNEIKASIIALEHIKNE